MLDSKAELLEMLPLLGLLLVVHHNVWLLWRHGTSQADLPRAPVLEIFLRAFLYPPYELLHHLKRPPLWHRNWSMREGNRSTSLKAELEVPITSSSLTLEDPLNS